MGDYGNLVADENGVANVELYVDFATLFGENTILGRTLVIHADPDDLGTGTGTKNRSKIKIYINGTVLICHISR